MSTTYVRISPNVLPGDLFKYSLDDGSVHYGTCPMNLPGSRLIKITNGEIDNTTLYKLVVPNHAVPGETFKVLIRNEEYDVLCPLGATPGYVMIVAC